MRVLAISLGYITERTHDVWNAHLSRLASQLGTLDGPCSYYQHNVGICHLLYDVELLVQCVKIGHVHLVQFLLLGNEQKYFHKPL